MHRITALEDTLYLDHDGSHKKQLTALLESEKKRLETVLRDGCPPQQYRDYAALCSALHCTQTVIQAIWCHYHGSLTPSVPSRIQDKP